MCRSHFLCVASLLWTLSPIAVAQTPARTQPPAPGSVSELADRLPGGANAVFIIDVARFTASPLGQANDMQAKLVSGYADRPLAVPATARRVAVGALVHPAGLRSIWQAAVIELSTTPRLEPMLRKQGGYLDQIEGRETAWTPRDSYYLALDEHTLAVVRPAQRQLVRRWLKGQDQARLSPYIKGALAATATSGSEAVLVLDLDDVVGAPALRYAYGMGKFPSLEKVEGGADKLIQALATVRGTFVTIHVTDHIEARCVVDFDEPVSALGAQAKPFVIEAMTAADLYEPGLEQWEFKAEGKRITGTGRMELAGLNRLVALLSPANIGDAEASTDEIGGQTAGHTVPEKPVTDPQQRAAMASQSYYRAVAKKLDMLSAKPSPQQGASWLVGQARAIEQLPLLDVDPELAAWGATMANALHRAAQELGVGQQRAQVAANRVQTPTGSGLGEGSIEDSAESRAAFRNAQQQRREASQTERADAAERAFAILNEVLPTRAQIRSTMVQRYGVEF